MSHNTAVVNVRMPPEIKEQLQQRALEDKRKVSDYVRLVLLKHLKDTVKHDKT